MKNRDKLREVNEIEKMKIDTVKYLTNQLRGLKDYYTEYSHIESLINMKQDRIKATADFAIAMGLIHFEDYMKLRADILNGSRK